MDGAEEEASSNHVRAPSSLTSSPMAKGRMKLPQVDDDNDLNILVKDVA